MKGKADPSKFTIKLSVQSPDAQRVTKILNGLGHNKGQFIVSAILCYLGTPDGAIHATQLSPFEAPPANPLRTRKPAPTAAALHPPAHIRPTLTVSPVPDIGLSGQAQETLIDALAALSGGL